MKMAVARKSTVVFGVVVIGVVSWQIASTAGHKLFWYDEGNEIVNSCSKSYLDMSIHGASSQCSPAPLYYVVQKFVVSRVPLDGKNILYSFRAISIVSSALALLCLFFEFTKYLGFPWGLFVLFMTDQGQFRYFGSENRPYMLWVLLFTATLVRVSSLIYKPWHQVSVTAKTNLAFLVMGLSLVAGGGMVQSIGFLAAFLVWEESLNLSRWVKRPSFRFGLPVTVASCALGIYYVLQGCLQYNAGKWDLLITRDLSLVSDVISLLCPLPSSSCRDYLDPCGSVTSVLDVFLVAGLIAPLALWRKRASLAEQNKFPLAAAVVSLVQICCAAILGILVARAHYYFIGRIFIYLIVLRAVLVVCGAYFCLSWALEKWNKRPGSEDPQWLQACLVAVLALGLSVTAYRRQQSLEAYVAQAERGWPALIPAGCPFIRSPLAIAAREEHSIQGREESGLNFIAIFGEKLKTCGWVPSEGPPSYVIPKRSMDGKAYTYEIADKLPVGSSIVGFFHQPLSFQP